MTIYAKSKWIIMEPCTDMLHGLMSHQYLTQLSPKKFKAILNSDGLQETVVHRKCNLYKLLQKHTALLCRTLMSKCHVNNSGQLLSHKNFMEVFNLSFWSRGTFTFLQRSPVKANWNYFFCRVKCYSHNKLKIHHICLN